MSFVSGTRLGPYEVVGPLGAGGMGEVYRAKDTRLERTVAIKVLNSNLIASPEVKARFQREAKIISQLQHPNICVLHDIGSESGIDFLVMELLEGESVAERLKRGALSTAELLRASIEIADALNQAHRAGVVHRDLKPGNVMLTKSGAKLLDFGLAKPVTAMSVAASGGASPAFTAAPTITSPSPAASPVTTQGSIIGTIQYMSPEQIRGQEADARSDIFAFGAMLYEMATGKRAFTGKSQLKVASSILEDEPPPIRTFDPKISPELERIVLACLAKDPEERFQCAQDLKLQLRSVPIFGGDCRGHGQTIGWTRTLAWCSATALLVAIVASAFWVASQHKVEVRQPRRFDIDLGSARIRGLSGSRVAISPDGHTLVMVISGTDGKPGLYVRRMDRLEVVPLAGTEDASQPFISPDGKWVGFSAVGKLKKVPLDGGATVTLCDVSGGAAAASWANDGRIVFSSAGLIREVSSEGGTPATLEWASKLGYSWLEFLPGSRGLLAVVRQQGRFRVDLLHMDTHKIETLITDGSWPRYLSNGYLVYAQYGGSNSSAGFAGGLLAFPFDLKSLKKTGDAQAVLQDVQVGFGGAGFYDIANEGTMIYFPGPGEGSDNVDFVWSSPSGKVAPIGAPAHNYHSLHLSPDGKQIAFSIVDLNPDVGTYDIAQKRMRKVTFEGHSNNPVFTSDSKRVIYASFVSGFLSNLRWKAADGSGEDLALTTSNYDQLPTSTSPDGLLLFTETHPDTKEDIYMMSLHGDASPRPWLNSPFNESQAVFSPDGKFIAYTSDESEVSQVYVRPLDGKSGKWQASSDVGRLPRWSNDGTKLYFLSAGKLMVVNVSTKQGFSADVPRVYMSSNDIGRTGYDIAADGRVLEAVSKTSLLAPQKTVLRVIENFDSEVRARLSPGK
jgi:eukaryotic-like serine/threonine-protein kinase